MAVWTQPQLIETYLNRRIDSEFFDPEYIKAETETLECQTEKLGKLGVFFPGPFGSAFHVQNYDFKSSYRYIRGRDVKPFFLLDDDNRYIPESDFNRLTKYSVLLQDLMISVVGTLGNVSICTEDDTPAIFSCKSTIFRAEKIDPYYLLAYLNCHYGRMCLLRRQRGAVQTGLNIEDLHAVPVPRFKEGIEKQISSFVQSSRLAAKQAKAFYNQAQKLLESELGLDKLKLDKLVGYTAQFSELELSRRADPEYFDPVAASIVAKITEFDHIMLGSSFAVGNGFPWHSKKFLSDNSGEPVVRIRNIRPTHIDVDELTSIDRDYARKVGFSKANKGEIVIGMDGLKYFYASILEGDCYINQRVAHLKPLSNAKISSEYATFIINSRVGQTQLLRDMTIATTVGHITNRNIAKLVIPYVSDKFHDEITSLVRTSINKKQESKQLLDQAKSRVEQLIEEAVQA